MYAVLRPVANPYLVRERDRRRTRELLVLIAAILPPLAVLFFGVRANLQTIELGYQIGRLEKQRDQLLERRRRLVIEKAQASALSRIEGIARGTLGLVPPRPEQVVLVRDSALTAPAAHEAAGTVRAPGSVPASTPIGPPAPPATEEGF